MALATLDALRKTGERVVSREHRTLFRGLECGYLREDNLFEMETRVFSLHAVRELRQSIIVEAGMW